MSLFDDSLGHEESLFEKPGVLSITYLPRLLPYREDKQKQLAQRIKRIKSGGSNVLIHGASGIGKSACVRYVLRELKEEREDIKPIYLNCWKNNTYYSVVKKVCKELGIKPGDKTKETLLDLALSKLNDYQGAVLAFDEVDQAKDRSFLYQFEEGLDYKTMFLVSTEKDWYAKADKRIRSRVSPELIEFQPYNREETRGILKERKDNAFVKGVWSKKAFKKVVGKSYGARDIRLGLSLMKKAGQIAEEEASRKIKLEHVDKALESGVKKEIKEKEDKKEKSLGDFS